MINPASAVLAGFLQRAISHIPEEEGVKKKGVVAVHRKGTKGRSTVYGDGTVEDAIEDLLYVIFETDNIDYGHRRQLDPKDFFERHLKGHTDDELDEIKRKIKVISSYILDNKELSQQFDALKEVTEESISQHRKISKSYLECYKKKIRSRLKGMEESLEIKKSKKQKWLFSVWERSKEEDLFAKDYFRDIIDEYEYQKELGNIIEKERPLKGRQFVIEQIKDILSTSS